MTDTPFELGSIELHPRVAHAVAPDGPNAVIDGDTLKIGGERWRLYGWDAPPIRGNCCDQEFARGQHAKAYLEQLLRWGAAQGTLKFQIRAITEKHHRRMVSITINGEDVGKTMARHGLAAPYDGRGPKPLFCTCELARARYDAELALFGSKQERAALRKQQARQSPA